MQEGDIGRGGGWEFHIFCRQCVEIFSCAGHDEIQSFGDFLEESCMRVRRHHSRRIAALEHPAQLVDESLVSAQLDSRRQSNGNQSRILAGEEKAVKHRIGFGDDANPVAPMEPKPQESRPQDTGLIAQIAVRQYRFQHSPMIIEIKACSAARRVFQSIDQIDESTAF